MNKKTDREMTAGGGDGGYSGGDGATSPQWMGKERK